MAIQKSKRISYGVGCIKSLRKLPNRVFVKFMDLMTRYMSDPESVDLSLENIGAKPDDPIKFHRIDDGYLAIAFEFGNDLMFVHANEDTYAIEWASKKKVKLDNTTNRVRIVEETEIDSTKPDGKLTPKNLLFKKYDDERLLTLGVLREELPLIRSIETLESFEKSEDRFDSVSFLILYGLVAGYSDEEVLSILGIEDTKENLIGEKEINTDFGRMIESNESRQTIFIPESEQDLRQIMEGNLEEWRIFLHPQQRKLAYNDYNGPALVRGGAGTGKTVVAMHRAKYLADEIAKSQKSQGSERVLLTTFTTNLAMDIEANLNNLCSEHFKSNPPRIEVTNLDKWVNRFLKTKGFDRKITYFGQKNELVQEIWESVFDDHELPNGLTENFIKAEWSQIIQAKGIMDRMSYLRVVRTGRGTSLDRRKRAKLWDIFADVRTRMISEGLAEPDDAYREAVKILTSESHYLPYSSVIVDEAQDMGEQALKLIRAIAPSSSPHLGNSVFIVGDAHQRIYNKKASMSSCGINVVGRTRRLKLNYRTSHEIRTWAVSILEGVTVDDLDNDLDTLNGYASLYHGSKPEFESYNNENEEIEGLKQWIKKMDHQGISISNIGILSNRLENVKRICTKFKEDGIQVVELKSNEWDDLKVQGVRVATMHRSKGLEFDAVALPFLSKDSFPSKKALKNAVDSADREDIINNHKLLLHVAATRAKKSLRISWCGKPNDLVKIWK